MEKIAKKIYRKLFKSTPKATPYSCPVCQSDNVVFNPLPGKFYSHLDEAGFEHSIFLFETLNLFNYACSNCNGPDRDRLYAMYLKSVFESKDPANSKLLDIAPTQHLTNFFLKYISRENYRTADLFMDGVDDKVDIQNMDMYADNSWDFVICSHVLEHVEDDVKAMKEIYRVLKPNGKAILMAPVNLGLSKSAEADLTKTYTEEQRWKHFGQDDHQRLYSKQDFIDRIKSAGFKLNQLDINYFGADSFTKHGINRKSVLYIGEKI